MHDNACPNYEDIIEDYYYGHRWLKRHFTRMPKIGWHVDPFGHSASLPILLDKMGFMGLVINRIHHRDKRNRGNLNHLDFVWSPTPKTSLLTHILSDHYSPPDSLNLAANMNPYVPRTIFTNFSPFHQNFGSISTKVQSLMTEFDSKSNMYNTETMFLPLGDDFTHSDAVTTFDYTDYYLSMWKSNPLRYENTSIDYITPSEYFKKLTMEPKIWSKTYGDFFPYADQGVAYWTGYYTTRPHFKREVKIFGQVFRAFKQIFAKMYSMRNNGYMSFLQFYMESVYVFFDDYGAELGIFNHHDAISGTSPENTIIDYRERKNKII
jgi:hypothetical protein